jgi:hypothetical protein
MDIFIDTKSLSEQYPMTQTQADDLVNYVVKTIAASYAANWEELAVRELHASRQQYVRSLVVKDNGKGTASVMLVGQFPNMIESGSPAFDIKEGILNGAKAKTSKDGKKYNTVPFYVGTPTSLEENFNGGLMPKEIYQEMKDREVDKPLTLSEIPKPFEEKKTHKVEMKPKQFEMYEHKNSIYEGLTKKQDSVTKQNTFMSFRRVSENSDPASWLHPGLVARNFSQRALSELNKEVEVGQAIDAWLVNSGLA